MLIVTYHAVAERSSPVSVTSRTLEIELRALRDAGFRFVSLDQCADWLEGGEALPERTAAVTFDDGYASVATEAVPILERLAVPATVYIISGRIGADNAWPDQWRSVPRLPLADVDQIRAMAARGLTIGAHSWSHPLLPGLDEEQLQQEVVGAAARLESLLDRPVRHFAYPYGCRGPREIRAVAGRYRTAVTAEPRLVAEGDSRHELPRLDAHDLQLAIALGCLANDGLRPYLAVRRFARRVRRFVERSPS